MDMKRHMLNFSFISMLVCKKKEWGNYENGGSYEERCEIVIMKVNRKKKEIIK
jgi:hypothetical protein